MSNGTTLVLGATGKTGRRVAARLRLHGTPVRAASRSSRVRFDWSDPGSWDAALQDATAVYVVAPRVPGPVHEFVARAEAAGVQRLVLLSGRGADTWGDSTFGLDMRSAEDAVRGSALEWTVLRSSNFAQNFDEDLFHAPLVAGELALPAGAVPEPFVDVEDVADAAAVVLTEPGRHAGRVYELTGPRALTFGEAVELISRASGLPVAYKQVSPAEYTAALIEEGAAEADAHDVAAMFVLMERGLLAARTDDLATVLGRAPRTFEDYVVRAAAAGAWRRRVTSAGTGSLTDQDLEFLRRPLHGFLSVAAGPNPPQPRPVWFEATAEGTVQLFTGPDSVKVRRLRRDPRASIVVAAPAGERERWVSVAGHVTVEPDGAHDLCARLAARYWDLDDPARADDLAEIQATDQVRLVIHPETVSRYTY